MPASSDRSDLLGELQRSWGWILALGIVFMLCGAACIVGDVYATLVTVLFFSWLLLIGKGASLISLAPAIHRPPGLRRTESPNHR